MKSTIRTTNLRFNLEKPDHRRAWEYLQTMDRQIFSSYSQVICQALIAYFDRYYRLQDDPYLETREREAQFVQQIVEAVEDSLQSSLPIFLSGCLAGASAGVYAKAGQVPSPDPMMAHITVTADGDVINPGAHVDRSEAHTGDPDPDTSDHLSSAIDWDFLGD